MQLLSFYLMLLAIPKNVTKSLIFIDKSSGVLVGRAIWCISRLFSLLRDNMTICTKIFEAVSKAFCNSHSDLSVSLVACLCLSKLCNYLKNQNFDNEYITADYERLVQILKATTEETIMIPIETITALSKVNLIKFNLIDK